MKKIFSILTALCLLLSLGATMVSCGHKCEFSTDWNGNDTEHWRSCLGEDCLEIAEKAEHIWDDGNITVEPTQDADGSKTFTCAVCSVTKKGTIIFTGISEEDWNAALEYDVFENFAYSEAATTSGNGISVDTETVYKFTKDKAYFKVTAAGQSQDSYAPSVEAANNTRKQLVDSIKDMLPYGSFEYDAETKTYKYTASEGVYMEALGEYTNNITVSFIDGKLAQVRYFIEFTQNNIELSADSTITFSDYGNVTLDGASA